MSLPTIEDLILTKQVASRAKDLEDIRLLRILKETSCFPPRLPTRSIGA